MNIQPLYAGKKEKQMGKLIQPVRGKQTKLVWTAAEHLEFVNIFLMLVCTAYNCWRKRSVLGEWKSRTRDRSKGNSRNIGHLSCICLHNQKERLLTYIRRQLHIKAGRTLTGKHIFTSWNKCSRLQYFPFTATWISCTAWESRHSPHSALRRLK